MKIAFILTILLTFDLVHAQEAKRVELNNVMKTALLGASIAKVEKEHVKTGGMEPQSIRMIQCRKGLQNSCQEKYKKDCTCYQFTDVDDKVPHEARIIYLGVNEGRVVDVKEEFGYVPNQIWNLPKNQSANIMVSSFSGSVAPNEVYKSDMLSDFDKGPKMHQTLIRTYAAKWVVAKDKVHAAAIVWCELSDPHTKTTVKGKFQDCRLKEATVSEVQLFNKFIKENQVTVPY